MQIDVRLPANVGQRNLRDGVHVERLLSLVVGSHARLGGILMCPVALVALLHGEDKLDLVCRVRMAERE